MGEGECEIPKETTKKSRHRKKHLFYQILNQMEFYFSDSNLSKDRFLSQLLSQDPYIDIEVFLKFNKLRKLNCTVDDIRKAISKSELIELSEDGNKIHRNKPLKIKENVEECTIYIENIKSDANHEWLTQIYSEFGNVVYVSIPKYKHNKLNKGFAFIEFETEREAEDALEFFESIGCKMPSDISPDKLKSIATFEGDNKAEDSFAKNTAENDIKDEYNGGECSKNGNAAEYNINGGEVECNKSVGGPECSNNAGDECVEVTQSKKRKLSEEHEQNGGKKLKIDETDITESTEAVSKDSKKKKSKKDKKKSMIKELGLQVLSKKEWKRMRNRYLDLQRKKMKEFKQKEWKRMRNRYLDLQRKKMKEFKQYLNKQKFSKSNKGDKSNRGETAPNTKNTEETCTTADMEKINKLDYMPGVIVKISFDEPYSDAKKIKNELRAASKHIKYVDTPLPSGGEEVFLRFDSNENAVGFCKLDSPAGKKAILENDEEKMYWEKIKNDRYVKLSRATKKQRGRDKLLKKAEKERSKHLRFDETE